MLLNVTLGNRIEDRSPLPIWMKSVTIGTICKCKEILVTTDERVNRNERDSQ